MTGTLGLFKGITGRTTQFAWTITLATLSIFVLFIIPEQKRQLQEGLESKARGIAVGLQEEVAGAAVSEGYSSVVEHATQLVCGDPEVEFLVITKNDGYSVMVDRQGWRVVAHADLSWHPAQRRPSRHIGVAQPFGLRAFQYSVPFDYTGLQWGWIHVGLSLAPYDSSVNRVYRRTGALAIVCIGLSLAASLFYARKFVGPILKLHSLVDRLAKGDLSARANINSNDEIERLANAFNEMADAVLHRNWIIESVRFTAQSLQAAPDWKTVVENVLSKLGRSAEVNRVILSEDRPEWSLINSPKMQFEWMSDGLGSSISPYSQHMRQEDPRWNLLRAGTTLIQRKADISRNSFPARDPQPQSMIIAPVTVEEKYWGALVVQDCCRDRDWDEVEQDAVRAVAEMLGAAITRSNAQEAVVKAKSELEQRVTERTQQLQQQIRAKDCANIELEQAQQRLIELSRLSGMAEVATEVLHNVGNVLNSINVATNTLADRMQASRVQQLKELSKMLLEHQHAIGDFLTKDDRGVRVLPYLAKLSDHLLQERDNMTGELDVLARHVSHVEEIVTQQQTYARHSGVVEKVSGRALIEDALGITRAEMQKHRVQLMEEIEANPVLTTERNKVLQILLNLLRNAKDAVKASATIPRQVIVRLHCKEEEAQFQVCDNGTGIASEDLARIFAHGFTTKRNGHGFGLHSGAIAASELGGSLHVESAGPGKGATFTLQLPLQSRRMGGSRTAS